MKSIGTRPSADYKFIENYANGAFERNHWRRTSSLDPRSSAGRIRQKDYVDLLSTVAYSRASCHAEARADARSSLRGDKSLIYSKCLKVTRLGGANTLIPIMPDRENARAPPDNHYNPCFHYNYHRLFRQTSNERTSERARTAKRTISGTTVKCAKSN